MDAENEALSLVALLKRCHPPVVLTSGTFDLLNIGHEEYLDVAASYGGALIVGVDSDEKVKQRKGPGRPICCQQTRMTSVSCHPSVSLVILKNSHAVKWSLIQAVHPDVLIVSRPTYSEGALADLSYYSERVVVIERTGSLSTSYLIRSAEHSNNFNIFSNPLISGFCVKDTLCRECSDVQNRNV